MFQVGGMASVACILFFHISHSFFKEQCYLHLSTIKGTNTNLKAKTPSDNIVNCELFEICFKKDLKLY